MSKVTPFLMFDDKLEAAIEFYTSLIPESKVTRVRRAGKDSPLQSAEFVIGGQCFMGFNGGSHFKFSDGFSLFVACDDQAEIDRYWSSILEAGGTEGPCGWITDPFGLSWQIVPKRFMELTSDEDPRKVQAVVNAMMTMKKFDVSGLERAYRSAT